MRNHEEHGYIQENPLIITIPPEKSFYSLYADGIFFSKKYIGESGVTELAYKKNSAIFLYYTYPAHRRVYLVRASDTAGGRTLPGLSRPVKVILRQFASRVDKTKRAVSYLNTHHRSAYQFPDIFYFTLDALLSQKGKLDFPALDGLVKKYTKGNQEKTPAAY